MTNEAVIVELGPNKGNPVSFTVANAVAIAKGTICYLEEPKTARPTVGAAGAAAGIQYFAGIAAAEKVAADGSIKLALYTNGIFDLYAAGSENISAGQLVKISGSNAVALMDDDTGENQGIIVGKALEDVAVGTAETIQVMVGVR